MGVPNEQIQAIIDKISGGSMSRARANALVRLAGNLTDLQQTGMGIDSARRGQGMVRQSTTNNQDIENKKLGMMSEGLGIDKGKLQLERDKFTADQSPSSIENVNIAVGLFKPKKETGSSLGTLTTNPSSLSPPSNSFSDWWRL
jgi:hypothetical protein